MGQTRILTQRICRERAPHFYAIGVPSLVVALLSLAALRSGQFLFDELAIAQSLLLVSTAARLSFGALLKLGVRRADSLGRLFVSHLLDRHSVGDRAQHSSVSHSVEMNNRNKSCAPKNCRPTHANSSRHFLSLRVH